LAVADYKGKLNRNRHTVRNVFTVKNNIRITSIWDTYFKYLNIFTFMYICTFS